MKNPEKEKLIKDWLAFARENLLFAQAGMKEEFSPYHTICFLCQSSAEKYLKAFLISQGWILKKTHDLSELLDFCCDYDRSFDAFFPQCELLNEYITEGRYPGDLPFESIFKEDADKALKAAEEIEKQVLNKIKSSEGKKSLE